MEIATDATLEQELRKSEQPVLVDFWAPWCGPCKAIAPVLERISQKYEGRVRVLKLNVDDNPLMTSKYGVRGIPAILFFKQIKVDPTLGIRSAGLVDQIVGYADENAVSEKIEKILG